jgi:thiol:disulfide interchange protein DsbA
MRVLFAAFVALLSLQAYAQEYKEGTHYTKLSQPVPTVVSAGKIEVAEVFRFGCPACFRFEEHIRAWDMPEQAEFVKTPVVWERVTETHATIYHIGKRMKKEKEISAGIFKAIFENNPAGNQRALSKREDVLSFLQGFGFSEAKASKFLDNKTIAKDVEESKVRAEQFAIDATPELFVDGRYRIQVTQAGGFAEALKVAAYLVEKAAQEKGLN